MIGCLLLCEEFDISLQATYFVVTEAASQMIGTSANLLYRDFVSIHQLLYALMLPSGNDAAFLLAEYFVFLFYLGNFVIL